MKFREFIDIVGQVIMTIVGVVFIGCVGFILWAVTQFIDAYGDYTDKKYAETKYIIEIGNMITGKDSYWVKEYKQDGDLISFTDVYGKSYSIKTTEFVVKKKD
jgi:hypothetical protein